MPGEAAFPRMIPGGDPFPLPLKQVERPSCKISRRASQRLARRRRELELVNLGIGTLNWMAGTPSQGSFEPSNLQTEMVERVVKLASDSFKLEGGFSSPPTPEAALTELLRGADDYSGPASTLAAYHRERVSMPDSLHNSPALSELLPEDALHFLEAPERMLRTEEDVDCDVVPYWDATLRNNPRAYKDFIKHLYGIGYLDVTRSPKERAGMFFVKKSDGVRIRLIIDARRGNARFRDPPGISLATSEAFARFELECQEDSTATEAGLGVAFGLSDVKDCFHRMVQPKWMREYFSLDPVPAEWLGLGGTILDGYRLKHDDLIWPMPAPLCMGFSWSLFFAQKANQHLMSKIPSLVSSRLFSDRSHPVVIKAGMEDEAQPSHHYVHVDNLGMISTNTGALKEALTQVTNEFYARGLDLHPGEVAQQGVDTLGCRVDGVNYCTTLKPTRVHKVRQALRGLLIRGKCSGRLLENMIGHLTYSFLMARPLLSIFDRTYKFIKRHYDAKVPLWPSVRDELTAALGGIIFCQADWTRTWNKVVSASDASLGGFGVCTAEWPLEIVQNVGRQQERERFRRTVGHSARESALECARIGPSGSLDHRDANEAGWDVDQNFPEVPHEWLREERWDVKLKGLWKHSEKIFELETLALLKSFSRLAKSRYGRDSRQLLLVDNMAVALAFSRSRSKNRRVLQIIRKFSAWALGRNVACAVRWIPSELNAADKPSRSLSFEKSPNSFSTFEAQDKPSWQGEDFVSREVRRPQTGPEDFKRGRLGPCDDHEGSLQSFHFGPDGGGRGGQAPSEETEAQQFVFEHNRPGKPRTSEGQAKSANSGEKAEAKTEEVPGQGFSSRQSRNNTSRSSGRYSPSPEVLREGGKAVAPLCQAAEAGLQTRRRHRCRDREIHEQMLLAWGTSPQGGEASGGLHAQQARLRKAGIAQVAQKLEGVERLEKAHPGPKSPALAFGGVGGRGSRTAETRLHKNGCVHHGRFELLRTAGRASAEHCLLTGAPGLARDCRVDSPSLSGTLGSAGQDRRVRPLSGARLVLPQALGSHSLRAAKESARLHSTLGFQLRRLRGGVSESHQGLEPRPLAVSNAALRAKHRPSKRVALGSRGAEDGRLEEREKCDAVREVCPAGSGLPRAPPAHEATLPMVRRTSRGCHPRQKDPSGTAVRKHHDCYFLDLFSGRGGVSRSFRKLGFRSYEYDTDHGPEFDLTERSVLRRIARNIARGEVLGAMLAPPCSSFSVARDRTSLIRTARFPWGLPRRFLSPADQEKVRLGNACARSALQVIHALDARGLPWCLENPHSSKLWRIPEIQQLTASPHVHVVIVDFCQYKTAWKKPTRFLFGNLDSQDLARFNKRRCLGSDGLCSLTHVPHVKLTGSGPGGISLTLLAQPYPPGLCHDLAFVLAAPFLTTGFATGW